MQRTMRPNASVLILRAQVARDALPDALRAAGFPVDVVAVYETRAVPQSAGDAIAAELARGAIDAVTFTSSSTVDNLCDLIGPRAQALLARVVVASIGPITTATAERRALRVDVTAKTYTVAGLIDALEDAFAARGPK
jgi:uroporphyrinogen III methyltransferase/synthase